MAESKSSFGTAGSPEKLRAEDKYDEKDEEEDYAEDKSSSCHAPSEFKTEAKVEEPLSDEEILEALQKYFFEDESFGKTLESFVDKHSDVVDLDSEEYKLTYTDLYDQYKRLFEELLESFIARELHVPLTDVYRALKKANEQSETNPNSLDAFFAQILVASTDFEVFFNMLRDSARSKQSARGHK